MILYGLGVLAAFLGLCSKIQLQATVASQTYGCSLLTAIVVLLAGTILLLLVVMVRSLLVNFRPAII